MRRSLVGILAGIAAGLLASATAHAQGTVKVGLILPFSGQFADPGAQADNGVRLYMQQHGDTVAGKKIEIIRKDTGGIAPDVAKRLAQELVVRDKRRHAGRLLADAERAGGGRHVGAGEEIHGGDERGRVDRHDQVALHGAGVVHAAAVERTARHLGLQERRAQGVHDGGGFRRRPRRRNRVPQRVQGGGRRDRRRGALSGRQSGLLGLRAARQGPEPGGDLHLRAGRRAVAGDRQGTGGSRHRSAQDQDHGAGRTDRRAGAQEHGRHRTRDHHLVALRLQPRHPAQ